MSVIQYIECFTAVIEHGSFTAAANALNISKPVVSKQVSQLEKQLGVQLIQRTTRRLHLTHAGEIFSRQAQRIMADIKEAELSVLPLQSEPQGRLRISAPESLAMTLLPEALLSFQQLHPKIDLDVRVTGRLIDLVEEGIDVSLRVGELEDSSLMARRLMSCQFHICASPDYLKQHAPIKHPTNLTQHNCLIYSKNAKPDVWSFTDEQGKTLQIKVNGNLRSDAGQLLLDSALSGNGIFIGPTYMISQALENGRLRSVLDDYLMPESALYAVYPYTKLITPKVRAFVDYLVELWDV
ncbi:MAG: LysR family transcriptional regulator [Thiotrichaceae bacterium]|nr:LysR family transcriptional regulator [Thiotrichaceae bacterium]